MKRLMNLSSISLVLLSVSTQAQVVQPKPNVIFILTDDQGYGDLACHGNPWIKTPNLDKLHSESVRFTNFHSGTTCAPTRSGIMTGKYCNKVGVWHTVNGREILSSEETTLPQTLQKAGYRTALFGKWHLGDNFPFRPQDRGFDEVLMHFGGGVGQQPDYWNNDYFDDTYFRNGKPEKFTGYCTDVWFSEAAKFIEANRNRPFFCYVSVNAPHSPFNVEEKYSNMYKNNPSITNPNFYGMISNIDENVGKLRQMLKKLAIDENTILVFMTDNGTSSGVKFGKDDEIISGYNAGMRGIKGSPYDGGHRVPFFIHWPKGEIVKGKDISTITSYIDVMPTLLDLCKVKPLSKASIDGISLTPLIYGQSEKWSDRILFTDTQREEHLVKWKQFAAMTDRWRLVGKDELYDITIDPGQKNNVAAQHSEMVEKLSSAYQKWWSDVSQNADKYQYIKVGTPNDKIVRLNCHDLHMEKGMPAWAQTDVRSGKIDDGFWAIEVVEPGEYEIELCRWPKESKLLLTDTAPQGELVPGGKPYPVGIALKITKAKIKIGDMELTQQIKPGAKTIKFIQKLNPGKTFLQTWLTDDKNGERSAYYVYVKKR